MEASDFGAYLKKIRKEKKLTIRQLELYSKVSNAYISQIERGERGVPSPDILQKLSKPLGVGYEELMEKAGYITKEEIFKTAISEGHLDGLRNFDTNDEIVKEIVKQMFESPDDFFNIMKDSTNNFLNDIFSDKQYADFWNNMIHISLTKKGLDIEKSKQIINELDDLSESEVDDIIDFIRYKKTKSKEK